MSFAEWHPKYAAIGIALFPVDVDRKKPLVVNWRAMGIPATTSLIPKFGACDGFGFRCGRGRRRLTVLDIDSTDERVLQQALCRHGDTPIVIQTASGKYHAWYRHAGEQRMIRPWGTDLPIDVLGAGYVVAPISRRTDGNTYHFIRGGLAEVAKLPKMRGFNDPKDKPDLILPDDVIRNDVVSELNPEIVRRGRRNDSLFNALMVIAKTGISADGLLENAMAINRTYDPPLSDGEVMGVVNSVMWYTEHGLNFKSGSRGLIMRYDIHDKLIEADGGDALLLLTVLQRRHFGQWGEFPISFDWVHEILGWGKRRFMNARDTLENTGVIVCTHRGGRGLHDPSFYKWAKLGLQGEKTAKASRVSIRHT